MTRKGPRSEPGPFTKAITAEILAALEDSPLRTIHGLAKATEGVSRSQMYLLMRDEAVMDVAELFAICAALGLSPRDVVQRAEATHEGGTVIPLVPKPSARLDTFSRSAPDERRVADEEGDSSPPADTVTDSAYEADAAFDPVDGIDQAAGEPEGDTP